MKLNISLIIVGVLITAFSYFLVWCFGVPIVLNPIEFIAVATSYTCTILFLLQKRVSYAYGVVSTFFLCILFYTQGLLSLAIFNGALVLSLVYGYFRWGPDGKPIPVTITSDNSWANYILYFTCIFVIFYYFVGGMITDNFLASASAMAQLMLDNKKIENWFIWIVVNIISIVLFWQQGMYLLMIQFIFFLINAIFALFYWKRGM